MATESTSPVSIVLLDAHDLVLEGTRSAFGADRRFTVTATSTRLRAVASLRDALEVSDVVLVDPVLEDSPVADCLPVLLASHASVVVYTAYFDPQFFLSALLSQVRGFISKSATGSRRLVDLVWTIVRHKVLVVDSQIANYFWSSPEERVVLFAPSDHIEALTPREKEIIHLLGTGMNDGDIALRFNLSLSTVQTHVQNIERKLGARGRFDLALRAVRSGLINPSARIERGTGAGGTGPP